MSAAPPPRTATSKDVRASAAAPTSSARRWRPPRRSTATSSTSSTESADGWSRHRERVHVARHGRVAARDRPAGHRHRPDHPQAVPEADRAHRVRRVPVLRLATRRARPAAARVRAERSRVRGCVDPAHRTQLRLRLVARARRLGAAGLRVRRRDRLVVRGHLPDERLQDRPGHDRAAGSRGEAPDRARRPGRGCRDERRPGATHDHDPQGQTFEFEFDEATRTWLLHGLDEIALTLQHEDEIAAYERVHGVA